MGHDKFKRPLVAPSFTPSPSGIPLADLAQGTNGQIPIAQTAAATAYKTMSGDATIDANGVVKLSPALLQYAEVDLATADVIDTGTGKFGHANGLILAPSPGAGKVIELVSVILSITFGVAGFTAGGNVSVCWAGGGAAISGVAAANVTFGAGASAVYQFLPLATAGNALVAATGINLKAATAFTNTGGATGSAKIFTVYRVHTL